MQHQSLIVITPQHLTPASLIELAGLNTSVSQSDTFSIDSEGKSIGVAAIKKLVEWSSNKPFNSPIKMGIIYQAEEMTEEAQNALLKTLEEPVADTLIVLVSASAQSLLPTIRSRCQSIYLAPVAESSEVGEYQKLAQEFYSSNFNQRLELINQLIADDDHRVRAERFLDALISHLSNVALGFSDSEINANVLELCAVSLIGLKSGTNVKLTLENLAASIKSN